MLHTDKMRMTYHSFCLISIVIYCAALITVTIKKEVKSDVFDLFVSVSFVNIQCTEKRAIQQLLFT